MATASEMRRRSLFPPVIAAVLAMSAGVACSRGWPTRNQYVCVIHFEAPRDHRFTEEGLLNQKLVGALLRQAKRSSEPEMLRLVEAMREVDTPARARELDRRMRAICDAESREYLDRRIF
jgi:hypothetical protein